MQIDLSGITPPTPERRRQYARSVRVASGKAEIVAAGARSRCADAIGAVSPGMHLHAVSCGEWSMHDTIVHLATQIAPCDLHLATWSISDDALRMVLAARDDGRIRSVACLFDWRVKVRNPDAHQLARAQSDRVRIASCHAKAALLRSPDYALVVLTSANLTGNPRIETYMVIDSEEIYAFHRRWIEEEIDHAAPWDAKTRRSY